jgi:hypothetical protein
MRDFRRDFFKITVLSTQKIGIAEKFTKALQLFPQVYPVCGSIIEPWDLSVLSPRFSKNPSSYSILHHI